MTSLINLSTGPVGVSGEVMQAYSESPFSHRSPSFKHLFEKTIALLCEAFNVQKTYLISGSGTAANECMLQQIKQISGTGLILSNGEFGTRLIQQASRNNISFLKYQLEWGKEFDLDEIKKIMLAHQVRWIRFCHCETSTGVINDLEKLITLCQKTNTRCFVDCMSTVGTSPLNLSQVSMATASSGKGLAALPGLGIVFSNMQIIENINTPAYFDLAEYDSHNGIPFTISSNLVKALNVSISQKLKDSQYQLLQNYGELIFTILNSYELIPFSKNYCKVFTIVHGKNTRHKKPGMTKVNYLQLSYESYYLKIRGWQQLALFGFYTNSQLMNVVNFLTSSTFRNNCLGYRSADME